MFETLAEDTSVLLTTHSDRMLDGLAEPARSVVVTDLTSDSSTRLRRLDKDALTTWLDDYRGVGDVRAEGHLHSLLPKAT
jgi:predicted ATPase